MRDLVSGAEKCEMWHLEFFLIFFFEIFFEVLNLKFWNGSFEFEVWSIVFFICHVTIDEYDIITFRPYIYIHTYVDICVYIYITPWSPDMADGGQYPPRGEPLAKFFKNSLLLHSLSNGHGPRPPNPVVFLKMTPKFWGKFRKWDLDFFWSFFFEFFFFWDFEFDVLNLKFLLILKFWIWPQQGAGAIP